MFGVQARLFERPARSFTGPARSFTGPARSCTGPARSCTAPLSFVRPGLAAALAFAVVTAACGDGSGVIDPPGGGGAFAAAGSVHAPSTTLPAGLQVTITGGGARFTAPVQTDGAFSVQGQIPGDSVDIIIDAPGPARTMLPSLIRVSRRASANGLRIVLVPRSWTVQGGAFHGQTVSISLEDAFRPPCTTPGDTNCDGFYPRVWTTGVKLWPAGVQVPVAFDHSRSHQTITPADSATLWSVVNRMNSDYGVAIFRPARVEELGLAADGRPTHGVSVRVDTTLAGFGAWTNWWWNSAGEMYAGLVRTRTTAHMRSPGLMTHEMLHTQGFKHSCSWNTVMGGYGCGSSQSLTVSDIAYAQLARAIHDLQRQTSSPHGLIAALQGERVVMRNLPVLELGAIEGLRVMRGDSIGEGDHVHH